MEAEAPIRPKFIANFKLLLYLRNCTLAAFRRGHLVALNRKCNPHTAAYAKRGYAFFRITALHFV